MASRPGDHLPFRRRPFLNREPFRRWAGRLPRADRGALIIEGRGGMGKTFFLNTLAPIFAAEGAGEAGGALLVGAIEHGDAPRRALPLDLIYADAALPLTIEQMLIDCVERSPSFRADDLFGEYRAARAAYELRRRHLSFHDLRASEGRLREAFFEGWGRLADRCGARLIVSFDTCEYLERSRIGGSFKLAESADATGRGLGVRAQLFDWLRAALGPGGMRRTSFIFCGRGVAGSALFRHLDDATGGRVEVEELEGLDEDEAADYLALDGRELGEPRRVRAIAHMITDGLPIRLDLLAELLDEDRPWCAANLFGAAAEDSAGDLRDRFYGEALRRFFDPARYLDLPAPQQAFGLALVCLAYARCGATVDDMQEFVASYGGERVDDEILRRYLDGHALVKKLSPRVQDVGRPPEAIRRLPQYFLHDQLWVDIDAIFGDTGTNADVWEFLSRRRRAAIDACVHDSHARRRAELICEHLIVAMHHDPVDSYRLYTSYVDQALLHRDVDSAIVISETFWRTLYYETSGSYGRYFPVLSTILGSRAIAPAQIEGDEMVRHLRILGALSTPDGAEGAPPADGARRATSAARQAHELYAGLRGRFAADRYLWATCTLGLIDVLLTHDPYSEAIRGAIVELIDGLEGAGEAPAGPPAQDWRNAHTPLLTQRRDLILARAYRYRGELNEALHHFADAISYTRKSIEALDRYSLTYLAELNDDITREYALAHVGLAGYLTRAGRGDEAQRHLAHVRQIIRAGRLSAYDSAVTHGRYALISPLGADASALSTAGDGPALPSRESQAALDKAEATGARRAVEIARLAHLSALRIERRSPAVCADPLRQEDYDRRIDAQLGVLLRHGDELLVSPDMHYDIAHEITRVYRDRFARQYDDPPAEPDLWPLRRAYRLIAAPGLELRLRQALRAQPYRRLQYADMAAARISLFSALLMVLRRAAREHGPAAAGAGDLAGQIARVGEGAPGAPRGPEDLAATLDEIEGILREDLGDPQRSPAQDRFIYVVLGKIALQRGLLLVYADPAARDVAGALEQCAAALALANLFTSAPIHERDAFRDLIERVFGGGRRGEVAPDSLARAVALLPREAPPALLARIPASDRADLRAAWHQALRQLPISVRRLMGGGA